MKRKNLSIASAWKLYYVLDCLPGTYKDLEKATGFSKNSIHAYICKARVLKMVHIGDWRPVKNGGRSMAVFYYGDRPDAPYHTKPRQMVGIALEAHEVRLAKLRGLKHDYEAKSKIPKPIKEDAFMAKLRDAGPANPFSTLFQIQGD